MVSAVVVSSGVPYDYDLTDFTYDGSLLTGVLEFTVPSVTVNISNSGSYYLMVPRPNPDV